MGKPHRLERVARLGAVHRPDQPAHVLAVLAQRRIGGLRQIPIATQPRPRQPNREDRVLAKELLQLARRSTAPTPAGWARCSWTRSTAADDTDADALALACSPWPDEDGAEHEDKPATTRQTAAPTPTKATLDVGIAVRQSDHDA